ncbi:hypothetical protein K402DRAFT_1984 [Aulographum hederae CBS 113979]|uniref:Uncharacterized protein n=1 Tax=Aulographum hederae CBS 113979 TaxID=1176131 RepID=A0A6G1HGV4_9PEZI|nr:hypothetical protein K402DRAFT_1984 [Aulographum hederae CBS 113979]
MILVYMLTPACPYLPSVLLILSLLCFLIRLLFEYSYLFPLHLHRVSSLNSLVLVKSNCVLQTPDCTRLKDSRQGESNLPRQTSSIRAAWC